MNRTIPLYHAIYRFWWENAVKKLHLNLCVCLYAVEWVQNESYGCIPLDWHSIRNDKHFLSSFFCFFFANRTSQSLMSSLHKQALQSTHWSSLWHWTNIYVNLAFQKEKNSKISPKEIKVKSLEMASVGIALCVMSFVHLFEQKKKKISLCSKINKAQYFIEFPLHSIPSKQHLNYVIVS